VAEQALETLDGGVQQIVIRGEISDGEEELYRLIGKVAHKFPTLVLNCLEVASVSPLFAQRLEEYRTMSRLKIVVGQSPVKEALADKGYLLFPSIKSAQLAITGEDTLRTILAKLKEAPILSAEAYQVLGYMNSPDADFDGVVKRVEKDQNICSQIVKVANSAFFFRSGKVDTLTQAVSRIGLLNIQNILVRSLYNGLTSFFQSQQDVIIHSQKCATLANYIAQEGGRPPDERAKIWLGALMHDVGRQAMAFVFPEKYAQVTELMTKENRPSYVAELYVFGTEHQVIGRLLAKKWNFPEYLTNIIGDHHSLAAKQWNTMTLPVFCANSFMNELEGIPFVSYYQRLEGYYFMLKKDLPWKDVPTAFKAVVEAQFNDLLS